MFVMLFCFVYSGLFLKEKSEKINKKYQKKENRIKNKLWKLKICLLLLLFLEVKVI